MPSHDALVTSAVLPSQRARHYGTRGREEELMHQQALMLANLGDQQQQLEVGWRLRFAVPATGGSEAATR